MVHHTQERVCWISAVMVPVVQVWYSTGIEWALNPGSGSRQSRSPVEGNKLIIRRPINKKKWSGAKKVCNSNGQTNVVTITIQTTESLVHNLKRQTNHTTIHHSNYKQLIWMVYYLECPVFTVLLFYIKSYLLRKHSSKGRRY